MRNPKIQNEEREKLFMCYRFFSAAICIAALAAPSFAGGDFVLSITDAEGVPGETVQVFVLMDNVFDVNGWTFGIEVDSPASITGAATGADVPIAPFGSTSIQLFAPTGLTHRKIIDSFGQVVLDPGVGHEIFSVDILIPLSANIGDQFAVDFTSTLGMPLIETMVINLSGSFTPQTEGGLVTVVPAPSSLALLGLCGIAADRRRR